MNFLLKLGKKMHSAALLFLIVCPSYAQKRDSKEVPVVNFGEILSCLRTKLDAMGSGPPQFAPGLYRIRFFHGVLTPGDDAPNELQLIVYAPREATALYYRVYLETENGRKEVYIGSWGTLKKQRANMILDENPGGQATYIHITKILGLMERRPAISVPERNVKPGAAACVYQP